MLRLVHPAREGQDPPKRRKGTKPAALFLTPEETRHARAFLRNTARAFGTWACFADAIHVPCMTLRRAMKARGRPPVVLIVRAARAAGVSVDAVLSGSINDAGRCKTCGSRVASGRVAGGAS